MATIIRSTQLDFDTIKARLKDYLKQQSEFSDYDFEASGLSNILDVLAYNTHFSGLISNFALNESFINTAQLRSSVVSLAEGLGYVPKSYTSSQAELSLSVQITASDRPTAITLPRNTQFTSAVAGITYTFQTRESFTAIDSGTGFYQFINSTDNDSIPVFEGAEKTKTFFVGDTGDSQIYVIPDISMDHSTMRIRVFNTSSSPLFDTYTNINKAVRITDNSTFYQIKEAPNGYYEIIFGNGIATGKRPVAGNKIVIDYLSTFGTVANGATTFTPTTTFAVNSVNYNLAVVTTTSSSGGAYKENLESIRQNAPISFISQRRLVTAEDYKGQILANYGAYLDDVIAYSGSDAVPPIYGIVYVSLKFKDNINTNIQQNVKDEIRLELSANMAVMSIFTEFIDPIETLLDIQTTFNLDPDLTNATAQAIQNIVQTTINNYFAANLGKFDKVFRRSNLLTIIDAIDPAILNSKMDIKMKQTFIPVLNSSQAYTINFPAAIAEPQPLIPVVLTSQFTFNSQTCFIKNQGSSFKLQVVSVDGTIEVDNVGSYNPVNGIIDIVGFKPSSIEGNFISLTVIPANQSTIKPLRNYVIDIGTALSSSRAILDYQNTSVNI